MAHHDDYPTEPVTVLAELHQHFEAMCPVTGEVFSSSREMTGLTKEMIVDYGDDWLDVQAADVPAGWLLRITQYVKLTSEQLPGIVDYVDYAHYTESGAWRPRNQAMRDAKQQLRRFARLKTWGGGGI